MKRLLTLLLVALAVLAGTARSASGENGGSATYQLTNLGSLGGTASSGASINNRGWISGSSDLPGDQAQHAVLWRGGETVDLGTLGGPNSGVLWPVKNDSGLVVGISQTANVDPLGERWSCAAFFPLRPP